MGDTLNAQELADSVRESLSSREEGPDWKTFDECLDALVGRVRELEEALTVIVEREPDASSSDSTAFFWNWAKGIARSALAASWEERP